jgi:hypothetical protein
MRPPRATLPLLLLAACSLGGPQQYRVPDLRILAIRDWVGATTFADADAGETVNLEALVANPRGRAGAAVQWYGCAPWTGGPLPACLDPQRLAHPETLPGAPGVLALGGGAVAGGTSSTSTVTLALGALQPVVGPAFDALITAANLDPSLRCRLFIEVPVVAVASAEGITEVAVKRVRLSPTAQVRGTPLEGIYVLNTNPAIATIYVSPSSTDTCSTGTPIASPLPSGEVTLCATVSAASIQTFNRCETNGTLAGVDETMDFQWYVSAGEIAGTSFDGNATGDDVKVKPVSGPFTLWAILRDGRGGTNWAVLSLAGP